MKTYWDLSEKERAALSAEDVATYEPLELMEAGVLRVEPYASEPVPTVPAPTRIVYGLKSVYRSMGVAFDTEEQARKFLELSPRRVTTDWNGASSVEHLVALESTDIVSVAIYTEADYKSHRELLKGAAEVRERNEKGERENTEARAKRDRAISSMWNDWREQCAAERTHRRVIATFDEYVSLAGDRQIAATFLLKVFDAEAIRAAATWFDRDIPTEPMPIAAPTEPDAAPAPVEAAPAEVSEPF